MVAAIGEHGVANAWTGPERRLSSQAGWGFTLESVGKNIFRYGLALIFLWIGLLKFTTYEAANIEPMVASSPIFAAAYQALGLQSLSNAIGVVEITIGLLIASRAFWPRASAVGSIGAVITFLVTLSFMLTAPGVWEPGYGIPALSGMPGQFLAKDLVLLGVSLWTAGEAWQAARTVATPL